MLKKTLMGTVIAAVFVGMILLGEYVDRAIMSTFLYIVIAICILEVRYALGDRIPKDFDWLIWTYAALYGAPYFFFGFKGIVLFTLIVFIIGCFISVFKNHADGVLQNFAFVLIYPALLLSALLYINKSAQANHIILDSELEKITYSVSGEVLLPYHTVGLSLVFAVSSFSDAFAYVFGTLFGKHKLCPNVSPNKTVEGAIGGLFGGLVASAVVYLLFEQFAIFPSGGLPVRIEWKIFDYIIIGIVGSVFTQLGDLVASLVKRHCGLKDYSHLLGSHGGFMDRFDGIVLNGCFVAMIYTFIL